MYGTHMRVLCQLIKETYPTKAVQLKLRDLHCNNNTSLCTYCVIIQLISIGHEICLSGNYRKQHGGSC